MLKKITITAAQLALINAVTCDQYHSFVNTPFNSSKHLGLKPDSTIYDENTFVSVSNGALFMPLIFNSQNYWCQTYNYQNKDGDHFGLWNPVT